ncbi:MAG: MFS transporter [Bacillota bacterium]|nr:MFS transporter [Bacillota bacterium]
MAKVIDEKDIIFQQEKMGMGFMVTVLVVMMTIQWMTLDMYLPALPVLKDEFGASEEALNVSLNTDLFFCGAGMLISGTISDKYGRKSIMILGLVLSMIGLFLAPLSKGVVFLSLMRGLCGLGGGFSLTVAAAIVRDSFEGQTFQIVTTITQAVAIIGPVFAPAIGSFLIEYLSWRWIFLTLGFATLITLLPFIVFTETWPRERRHISSVLQATMQSFAFVKNRDYVIFITMVLFLTLPLWAYIATCSYIYYETFGVSNTEYSILYATGTMSAFVAPFIYIWISRKSSNRRVMELVFALMLFSVAAFVFIAGKSPILFLIAAIPVIMVEAIVRSMAMVVVLDEHPEEAGSASSITGFVLTAVSVIATSIATLNWPSFIMSIAVITAASVAIGIAFWVLIIRKQVYASQLGIRKDR